MGSIGKKVTDDILGFDKNRFLGFKKKNIANAAGKIMTPGQLKTFGKVAKVAAPVMAFTPVGAAAGAAIKKGGKGMASVLKSVAGKTPVGSAVSKGLGGASKLLGKTPASKIASGISKSPVSKLIGKTPVGRAAPIYGKGVSNAAKAADMLKRMQIAGEVANPTGAVIKLPRGGMATIGGKLPPARVTGRVKKKDFKGSAKGLLALFLDLPFV